MKKIFCTLLVLILVNACGNDSTVTSKIKIAPSGSRRVAEGLERLESLRFDRYLGKLARAAGDVGHNTAAELLSLQYYILGIELCETVEENGSGYNNPSGCSALFTHPDSSNTGKYDSFGITEADADTSDSWIDFASPASVDRLSTATSVAAGSYRYGIVLWMRPFKVNASLSTPNGTTLKTCNTGTIETVAGSGAVTDVSTKLRRKVPNMTSCTQGLTTYFLSNGGTLFRFSSPITVDGGSSYNLDLSFNPDKLLIGQGASDGSGGLEDEAYEDDSGRVIVFPYLDLSPVLRQSSQKTFREVYMSGDVTLSTGAIVNYRLELYFAGAATDAASATVQAVNLRRLSKATSALGHGLSGSAATEVRVNSDNSIDVLNYEDTANVAGLTRQASVGGADTSVTLSSQLGGTTTTFTLTALEEVE